MLFSCSAKEENYINYKELIEYISNEDADLPSIFSGIYLFCEIDKKEKKYQLLDSSALLKTHYGFYQNMDYKDFVSKVFSNQLVIDCKEVYECFNLNASVTEEYNKNPFASFIKRYTSFYEENTYTLKRDLDLDVRLSVMYYSYLNSYYTTYDDIAGYYSCERMNSIPVPTKEESIFLNEE